MKKNSLTLIVFITILLGCNKEDFNWDLTRTNNYDVKSDKPYNKIDCESLNVFDTKVYNNPWEWRIREDGFKGKCIELFIGRGGMGGYIEFPAEHSTSTKLSFWVRSWSTSNIRIKPIVYVNDIITNIKQINSIDLDNKMTPEQIPWIQYESVIFPPNSYAIKIEVKIAETSTSVFLIDEIEFWCD